MAGPCEKCGARGERLMGYEERGTYDGVLVWRCLDCGYAWPRFTGPGRLAEAGERYVKRLRLREGK